MSRPMVVQSLPCILRRPRALAARIGRCCGLLLLLLLSSQLVTGCITTTISTPGDVRQARRLGPGDRIAFVPASREVESFVTCVLDGLEGRVAPARLVAPQEVYRLASATGVEESDVLPDVLEPEARARLAASCIRYVTVISGQTYTSPWKADQGEIYRNRLSAFDAGVYDSASGELVTVASASSQGNGGVFVFVPYFAPTEWKACGAMRDALLEMLADLEAGGKP